MWLLAGLISLTWPGHTDWTLRPGEAAHLWCVEHSVHNGLNKPSLHTLEDISCMAAWMPCFVYSDTFWRTPFHASTVRQGLM